MSGTRCAVIFNPVKVSDTFRAAAEQALGDHGYDDIQWLETEAADKGRSRVRQAVAEESTWSSSPAVTGRSGWWPTVWPTRASRSASFRRAPPTCWHSIWASPHRGARPSRSPPRHSQRTIDLVKLTIDGGGPSTSR